MADLTQEQIEVLARLVKKDQKHSKYSLRLRLDTIHALQARGLVETVGGFYFANHRDTWSWQLTRLGRAVLAEVAKQEVALLE